MDENTEKKIRFFIFIAIFLLLGASALYFLVFAPKPIYEESKDVLADSGNFEFTLDTATDIYEVQLVLTYRYGLGHGIDDIRGEIVSPSGKRYTRKGLLSAKGAGEAGTEKYILHFIDIKSEEGVFKMTFTKSHGDIKLKKATLKIFPKEAKE